VEDESTGKLGFVGNRTECALLVMARGWGKDYRQIRDMSHEQTVGEGWDEVLGKAGSGGRRRARGGQEARLLATLCVILAQLCFTLVSSTSPCPLGLLLQRCMASRLSVRWLAC
jgi:hypothetical protein